MYTWSKCRGIDAIEQPVVTAAFDQIIIPLSTWWPLAGLQVFRGTVPLFDAIVRLFDD